MSTLQRDQLEQLMRSHPFDPSLPIERLRSAFDAAFAGGSLPEGSMAHSITLGGRPGIRVDRDDASSESVLLYFHGGGYIAGSAHTHQFLAASLARRASMTALVPDYRLAPEHPFPAALDDAIAGYRDLLDSGVSPEQIVVAGDSAGGGLTLALLVALGSHGLPQPSSAVLFSPFVDLAVSGASAASHIDSDAMLTPAMLRLFTTSYLGNRATHTALASPLHADLTRLPPLLIQVGTHELLLDDATRLAQRAAHADVNVTLEVFAGMPHVFQSNEGVLDEAGEALTTAAEFIRRIRVTSV